MSVLPKPNPNMPFESEKQRKYLWAKHPEIAKKWTKKYGSNPKHQAMKHLKIRKKSPNR